jgi:hypothetical protein
MPETSEEASREAMRPQEEIPREYGPLKAERDGKPDEQQEMFWKG